MAEESKLAANHPKSLLIFGSYVLLGTLVLPPAGRIGFLGDFAGDIFVCQDNWFNFAACPWNFYVPIMAIYDGLYKKDFSTLPLRNHVFHLSLIVINAWLVPGNPEAFVIAEGGAPVIDPHLWK
jgi:hypothetical protein